MKVMRMLMAVILSLITFGCDNAPESVSVYDLKNRPDHWNNKEIVVWGYAVITGEFEDSGYIWQSKEDAAKKDLAPTVTIGDLSEKYPKKNWVYPYRGMVRVRGVFRFKKNDFFETRRIDDISSVMWLNLGHNQRAIKENKVDRAQENEH